MSQGLELSGSFFDSPTYLNVITLKCHMLFPGDPVMRETARRTFGLEFARTQRAKHPEFFGDLFDEAFDAEPLKHIEELAAVSFKRGIIAGMILKESVGAAVEGGCKEDGSQSTFIRRLSPSFGSKFSTHTINCEIWPNFRKVSHFWAAYVARAYASANPDRSFPCRSETLLDFLAWAEEFRRLGETHKGWKSREPSILRQGECVRSPPDRLPQVSLTFSSPTFQVL